MIVRKCNKCSYIGTVNSEGLCWDNCVATTIYNKEYKKYQTSKQNKIAALLKETINIELFCIDKVIDSACTLRRPDFVYDLGSHIVIIEVDEKAGDKSTYHKEDCKEEHVRMFELANCFEGRPLIFIRYNPDNHHIGDKLKKIPINQKETMLIKWINKAIKYNNFPQHTNKLFPTVLTVYLYYNEYDESIADFTELSQVGLTDGLIKCT